MDKSVTDILNQPLEVFYKPGPGNARYKYVKGEDVIYRLNKAFQHEWSSHVDQIIERDNQIIVLLTITVGEVSHQGFGGSEIAIYSGGAKAGKPVDISNSFKGAYTNALKKCAEQFGVGLYAEDSLTDNAPKQPVANKTYTPTQAPKPATTTISTKAQVPTSAPVAPQQNTTLASTFNEDTIASLQKQVKQIMDANGGSQKPVENVAGPKKNPTVTPQEPSKENPFKPSIPPNNKISDIQLSAINGLARLKQVTPSKVIALAIPDSKKTSFEELAYEEAKLVIGKLNSLDS